MPRSSEPADIVLLDAGWPDRALLRAQLIEEGYDVVATDTWPIPRQYLHPETRPRLLIVDLQSLPDPNSVLADIRALMKPDRVLVITALGGPTEEDIRRLGFRAISRPATIRDIVAAVAAISA